MIDSLFHIPAYEFLGLYFKLSVACCIAGFVFCRFDFSTSCSLPKLTRFDACAIAWLRGGCQEVLRTALFGLVKKQAVEIITLGVDEPVLERKDVSNMDFDPVEREIYRFLYINNTANGLFKNKGLKKSILEKMDGARRDLEDRCLARTRSHRILTWSVFVFLLSVLVVVGGARLLAGIVHGRDSGFLLILVAVSVPALYYCCRPRETATRLGKKYVKELQRHFKWLESASRKGEAPREIDPALAAGIFGATAIVGAYNKVFGEQLSWTEPFRGSGSGTGGCGGCGDAGGGCGGCGD